MAGAIADTLPDWHIVCTHPDRVKTIWQLLSTTFSDWSEDKAPRLGAALAYYTVFSLALCWSS